MAKVSICIPVFNRSDLVVRAINSCLRQSYTDIEIVVSDNASTDDTVLKVRELMEKDDRVKLVVNEKNYGALKNFWIAIENSKSDYVVLLGSDDCLSADFIESRIKGFIKHPEAAFVSGPMEISENGFVTARYDYGGQLMSRDYVYNYFYRKYIISYFCMFRRKDILSKFRFTYNDPFDWGVYEKGFGLDVINCLDIIDDYEYAVYVRGGVYTFYNHLDRESEQIMMDGDRVLEKTCNEVDRVIADHNYATYLFSDYFIKKNRLDVAGNYVKHNFMQLIYVLFVKKMSTKCFSISIVGVKDFIGRFGVTTTTVIFSAAMLPFYIIYRASLYAKRKVLLWF